MNAGTSSLSRADQRDPTNAHGLGGASPAAHVSPALSASDFKELQQKGAERDWGVAVGNLENAKLALDTLKSLVNDAVFLDEEAFSNANALALYQQRMQSQQRRIRELEYEVDALRKEVEKKDEMLRAEVLKIQAANNRAAELQNELDNSKVVFDAHFTELLNKSEEIERLKAIISGLQGGQLHSQLGHSP